MTFTFATTTTRRAASSFLPWVPLPYMVRAVGHLLRSAVAVLPLKPGGRKTSITLAAFGELQKQGRAKTMLVIAPLRACRKVWRQEGAKWEQFRHLRFSLLHGGKKKERLKDDADVFLINPEGVEWLCEQFTGRPLPFDVVTIDELTKFKNHKAKRLTSLRPRLKGVKYRWGLTGSFTAKGHMGLFGQMLILDDGAALGRYITHYRDQYFQLGYDGFTYELMPGAEKRITKRIAPYWFEMDEADYSQLPPLIDDPREIELEPASLKIYKDMKRKMIAELPLGTVTAQNAAAVQGKLAQMANGAVYGTPPHEATCSIHASSFCNCASRTQRTVVHIHDGKLDALAELLEELDGEPLLVAYEFNHDLDRIRERFGKVNPKTGQKEIPYLGNGTTAAQESDWIDAWNRNELPLFLAHPMSAGHALNLQEGNATHVCWFSLTWDWELYDQFIRRVRRSGNEAQRIFNHKLIVPGTIDDLKVEVLSDKHTTEKRLVALLNREIQQEAGTAAGEPADTTENDMTQKLSRQADAGTTARIVPKGWGRPANEDAGEAAPQAQPQAAEQRERIAARLAPEPAQETEEAAAPPRTASAFSASTQAARAALMGNAGAADEAPSGEGSTDPVPEPVAETTAKTTRRRAAPALVAIAEKFPADTDKIAVTELDRDTRVILLNIAGGNVAKAREMADFVANG